MEEFNLDRLKASPDYPKVRDILRLLLEARDALPAITIASAKLHNVDLTLADRIEECLEPWRVSDE